MVDGTPQREMTDMRWGLFGLTWQKDMLTWSEADGQFPKGQFPFILFPVVYVSNNKHAK